LRHRLAKHPRIQLRFSLTSGSWVTKSKTSPGSSSPDKGSRGTFTSVEDLVAAIGTFIDGWNERCQPAVWTNPGTARDGDPGQDERQAGHGQTDPFFAGPEADVAQVTTPTAGTGAGPGGSPAPTRT
jgi:hypothetical protein